MLRYHNNTIERNMMAGGKQFSKTKKVEKLRIDALSNAFASWARDDPDSFREVAPDLLRQGVDRAMGNDPLASRRLEEWLSEEWRVQEFDGLLEFSKKQELATDITPLNINRFKGKKREWLLALQGKFNPESSEHSGDFRRWDRHVRDQFIIIAMIANERDGVAQGSLARALGIRFEDEASKRYAANVVRAAKIALTRMARNKDKNKNIFSEGIFQQARGHGLNRIHAFEDNSIRKLTLRWVNSHPAKVLVPNLDS